MVDVIAGLLAAAILFVAPGLALLVWLLPDNDADWFEWLALSTGLSLGLFPLLLLWVRVVGDVRLGPTALWAILAICILFIAWQLVRRRKSLRVVGNIGRGFNLLLILTAGTVLGVRLWAIRGLNIPLWGDSYQHTMMAQLIVDNGGLFDSWLPYAPLDSFTYHFGFHTTVAFFHWLSGIDMPRAVLVVGQLLNALAAFTIYPLAVRLTSNRWMGLVAILIAAIISPMPGFYVNWGRYTQLAGLVILPVALWFTLEFVDHPSFNWQRLGLAIIAVAGLALTHYKVILLYGAILLAWWLIYSVLDRENRPNWLRSLGRLALLGALALLTISPWVVNTATSRLARNQIRIARIGHRHDFIRDVYNQIGSVRSAVPSRLLGLAVLGMVLAFIRKRSLVFFFGLWVAFWFLVANPYLFHLPGTGVVNNFAVLISLYIPVAIIAGYGVVCAVEYIQRYWQWFPWVAGILIVGVSLWGVYGHAKIVKPEFVMVTPLDERAMDWITANTQEDAKFLVNGFLTSGGTSVVGADAGWWIPLLTGRENTIPPLTYVSETPISPDYPRQVRELAAQIQAIDLSTVEGVDFLKELNITHIYVGQGDGRVGNPREPLLSAQDLLAAPYYDVIYHEDNVWVFEVRDELAGEAQ